MLRWHVGIAGYRSKARSLNNAYMLVYVRDADWDKVMAPTGKDEMSEHVRKQLELQLTDKDNKRRAKMQAHRFVSFKVVTEALMKKHVRTLPPLQIRPVVHRAAAHKDVSACIACFSSPLDI